MGRDTDSFEGVPKKQVLEVLRRLDVSVATIGKFTYLSRGDINIALELEDRVNRRMLRALSRTFEGVHIHYFFHTEMLPK
jgi:hypothetical protein